MYSVSYFNFGGLGALFGGLSPSKPPRVATGLKRVLRSCTSRPWWMVHSFRWSCWVCALLPPTAFCTTERFPSVSRLCVRKLQCFHDLATVEKMRWLDRELYAEPPLRFVSDTKFRVLTFPAVFFVSRQTRTCWAALPSTRVAIVNFKENETLLPDGRRCRKWSYWPGASHFVEWLFVSMQLLAQLLFRRSCRERSRAHRSLLQGVHNLRLHVAFDENVRGRALVI